MRLTKGLSILLIALFGGLSMGCGQEKKATVADFMTRWRVTTSFKYDLCGFVGILTGRELYKKYYGDLYAEWSRKLPPPVSFAVQKIDEIIGPHQPPGPRLCVLFSAVAAEDSIAAILRAMEDEAAVRQRLMASDFRSEKNWQQWQTLKPFLRVVLKHLQKEQFDTYWYTNLYPRIAAQWPRIQQELQSYDVIGDIKHFLRNADLSDSVEVSVLWLIRPHAVRLTVQRYLTDASYPMHITVKSAYHELLHPYCERLVDSSLVVPFESLRNDPFLQNTLAKADPVYGYKNFKMYCQEEVVLAADLWLAERRRIISQQIGGDAIDSRAAARQYLEKYEGGVHVLAAVIYSYLEAGLKLDRMSYADFLKDLFARGRLQLGKIDMQYREFMRTEATASQ